VGQYDSATQSSFCRQAALLPVEPRQIESITNHVTSYGMNRRDAQVAVGVLLASSLANAPALAPMMKAVAAGLSEPTLPTPGTIVPKLFLSPANGKAAQDSGIDPTEYAASLAENASIGWGQEGLDAATAQSARELHGLFKDSIAPGEREHYWPGLSMKPDTNAVAVGQMLTDALSRDELLRPAMQAIAGEIGQGGPSVESRAPRGGLGGGFAGGGFAGGGFNNGGFPGFAG
jgi:hypothetical protein